MTFAAPWWLLALALVPALALAARRYGRERALRFSTVADAAAVAPTWAVRLRALPLGLRLGALTLGVLALARPQQRDVIREQTAEGVDIVLVLDLSTSMLAEDLYPNRFEAAREVAEDFIQSRTSDRVGLVVFAAQAYTQAPLTLDYDFVAAMLRETRMGLVEDGTAIGTALATATARLRDSEAESKVVVLLTDGQNNRGEIDPATAADIAAALGVRVYTIGVGATGGMRSPFGAFFPQADVDEPTLRQVAEVTGGKYFRATDVEALRQIYEAIGTLEKTEIEETVYVDVRELYPFVLAAAFALLLLEVALVNTRLRRVP